MYLHTLYNMYYIIVYIILYLNITCMSACMFFILTLDIQSVIVTGIKKIEV